MRFLNDIFLPQDVRRQKSKILFYKLKQALRSKFIESWSAAAMLFDVQGLKVKAVILGNHR